MTKPLTIREWILVPLAEHESVIYQAEIDLFDMGINIEGTTRDAVVWTIFILEEVCDV
jgi:hypothetical protein